jgi:deoxyribodipyrimidine photolyase-related protein
MALVQSRFANHPGSLERFHWPVTRAEALASLSDFVEHRLPAFGPHQDAMWEGEPYLWHSLLSTSLNLKLLNPREVIDAALRAWRERGLALAGVEGFVRQVLGWREFIRGVYWHFMPGLAAENHFGHQRPLPAWYWTGDTHMACLRAAIGQTLEHGYAHHIQRLMVTGNFALLAGLSPQAVADWYLAVYVDAVEWAELPNTAGMALYANGGRFTSKPYAASGAYIDRMSNHCRGCRYRPGVRTGPQACPVTTLFWDFLDRHEAEFARNPRTVLMARNVARLPAAERDAIRAEAGRMLDRIDAL